MSTVSLKTFYNQPKKVQFNTEFDKINEFSKFEETLPNTSIRSFEKNPDHLSKIIEEDFETEYSWSKMVASNEAENNK